MINKVRYLQHTERARIEHDLTLTRLSEVMLRTMHTFVRGIMTGAGTERATIYDGLVAYPAGGMTVRLTTPAIAVQRYPDGNLQYVIDDNDGQEWEFTIDPSDPVQDRYDIIEAQIRKRDAFFDTSVDVVDPVSKVITPLTRPRDKEYYLYVRLKKGQNGQPPYTPTGGTPATVLGTTQVAPHVDLSQRYIIKLSVGHGKEFVEVDCRGANPAQTTPDEIVAALNSAGFGNIATNGGGFIRLEAPGMGENSVIYFRQPIDPQKDALTLILGITTTPGYSLTYQGDNPYFKVAEIYVRRLTTVLDNELVRNRLNKSDWIADANTIVNSTDYEHHRKSIPLDHADKSIYPRHLSDEVKSMLGKKITRFSTQSYAQLYPDPADATLSRGRVYYTDYPTCTVDGIENEHGDQEQQYTRSRVDQKQETWNGGNYTTLTTINEGASHRIVFTPSNPAQVLFCLRHNRIGFYVSNKGSGYERLTVILHNDSDNELARSSWDYAQLVTGWVYWDLPAIVELQYGQNYHYHVISENLSGGSTAQLGTNASAQIAFREMYKPIGGKYGSANTNDVIHVLDSTLNEVVAVNANDVDLIINCGDGYSSETAIDYMAVDFSVVDWATWSYNNYIGVDLKTGRVKLPAVLLLTVNAGNCYVTYNTSRGIDNITTKEIKKFKTDISLEDWIAKSYAVDISDSDVVINDIDNIDVLYIYGCTDVNRTITLPLKKKEIYIINNTEIAGTTMRYVTIKGATGTGFNIRIGRIILDWKMYEGLDTSMLPLQDSRIYIASCDGYNWIEKYGGNGEAFLTTTQSWAVPARVKSAIIIAKGGGGGGGGGSRFPTNGITVIYVGAGGGAGAIHAVRAKITGMLNVIIGAGGVGGYGRVYGLSPERPGMPGGGSGIVGIIGAQGGSSGGQSYFSSSSDPKYIGGGGACGYEREIINGYKGFYGGGGSSGDGMSFCGGIGVRGGGSSPFSGNLHYLSGEVSDYFQDICFAGRGGGYAGGEKLFVFSDLQYGNNAGGYGCGGGGGGTLIYSTHVYGGNGSQGFVHIIW